MKRLSIKELQKYPYPNLMAEFMESGYSICTVGERMGLGRYCENDDPEVWDRLTGKQEILYSEAKALSELFGVKFSYLFSDELAVLCERTYAYWHWYEHNKWSERELRKLRAQGEVIDIIKSIGKEESLELIKQFAEKFLEGGAV